MDTSNMDVINGLIQKTKELEDSGRIKPAKEILADLQASTVECLCGKKRRPDQMRMIVHGGQTFVNNICANCTDKEVLKHDAEMSRIVCLGCKEIVMRHSPEKDKDGFVFAPGQTYTIDRCMVCQPGTTSSMVLEKEKYLREQGKSIPQN